MAIHSMKNQSQLPSKANPGDVFYVMSNPHAPFTYFSVADGSLICLNDLFSGAAAPVRVVGPAGEPGRDGQSVTGPAGRDGKDGRDGTDGQTIRGPQGEPGPRGERGIEGHAGRDGRDAVDGKDGAVGPAGPQGPRGDLTIIGDDELYAAVKQLRQEKARAKAALYEEILKANSLMPRTRLLLMSALNELKKAIG